MSTLEKDVLVLNRNWQPVNIISVRSALSMMASDACTAIDFTDEGAFIPVRWNDWFNVPVRENDDVIHTPSTQIRAPRVIVAAKFSKVPIRRPKLSLRNLREHFGNQCAYTKKMLKPDESSMEHVVPKSKGGVTAWENCVLADKKVNNRRGNKPLEEVGLKLQVPPSVPKPKPFTVREGRLLKEWVPFV